MFKIRKSAIIAVVLLLLVSVFSGCVPAGQTTLSDMMKVLPLGTDSLFVIETGILGTVPELNDMWNTLTEQTLPAGTAPATLGMAASNGNLTGLCYTFDGTTPSYPDGTGEPLEIGGLTVTRTDNFWDSFNLENVYVVSVKDFTEEIITGHKNDSGAMYAGFQDFVDDVPEGIFLGAVKGFTIGGKEAAMAIALHAGREQEDPLDVTAVFRMPGGSTIALADFLERCGITDARITEKDGLMKVSGKLKPGNFSTLMDRLTGSW